MVSFVCICGMQWTTGRMSTAYVVYRVIVAALIVAWVIADFLQEAGHFYSHNYAIWLVFATNWSILTICVTAVWMALTSVYYYYATRHRSLGIFLCQSLRLLHSFHWGRQQSDLCLFVWSLKAEIEHGWNRSLASLRLMSIYNKMKHI